MQQNQTKTCNVPPESTAGVIEHLVKAVGEDSTMLCQVTVRGFAESRGMTRLGDMGPLHGLPLGCGQNSLAFLSISSSCIPFCLSLTKVLSDLFLLPPLSLHLASSSLPALRVKSRSLPLCSCLVYVPSCPHHRVSSLHLCSSLCPLHPALSPAPWLLGHSLALLDE